MDVDVADVADVDVAGPAHDRAASRRRWIVGGVALLLGAPLAGYAATRPLAPGGIAGKVGRGGPAKGTAPLVDHEAPNFRLPAPDGTTVELRQLRGKAVMLNFWATWCTPCKEELPLFEEVYRRYKAQDFVLLGVSIDSEAAARDVPAYMKEGGPGVGAYTFPVALDTKQEVVRAYKLAGIPSTFFIDREGVIRALRPGALNRQMVMDRLASIVPAAA
ncbi:MAG: TlpA family protein disulfide reductase [Chloroflexota bacterium]|nr:TlpA family protein disulfide reductase [Chloroflexota bacterium]